MSEQASAVYEIILEDTAAPRKFFRGLVAVISNVLAMGDGSMTGGPVNPGGTIISVRRIDTGDELFRHIEDMGDDEAYLHGAIQGDLDAMTAAEFEATWA